MDSVQTAMLALLRHALWNETTPLPADAPWTAVYQEMKHHQIVSLPGNVLSALPLPPDLKQAWTRDIIRQISTNEWYYVGQDQLLSFLHQQGIPTLILKGAASAQYYPHPELRTMGDVDFLVPVDRFESTLRLLLDNGYTQTSDLVDGYCEVALQKDGAIYEIHRGMSDTDGQHMDLINQMVTACLDTPDQGLVMGHAFPALPPALIGLSMLSHIRQHLRNGLGLRQIIDWLLYVADALPDEAWHNGFQAMVKQCGLETLAITLTRMGQLYLGLPSTITWCSAAQESTCRDLLTYLLLNGNFGQKTDGYSHAAQRMMMQKHYLWKMLCSMQQKGRQRGLVLRHPVLRPFAWAVQLGHYLRILRRRRQQGKTIRRDIQDVHWMSKMFEQLEKES